MRSNICKEPERFGSYRRVQLTALARLLLETLALLFPQATYRNCLIHFIQEEKKAGPDLVLQYRKKLLRRTKEGSGANRPESTGTEFKFTIPAIQNTGFFKLEKTYIHSSEFLLDEPNFRKYDLNDHDRVNEEISSPLKTKSYQIAILNTKKEFVDLIRFKFNSMSIATELSEFTCAQELLNLSHENIDIIILRADRQQHGLTGFEVCKKLRNAMFSGIICIHSDVTMLEYENLTIESGGNFYLSNSITEKDLLKILGERHTFKDHERTKFVLLFEDEAIFQRQWIRQLKGCEVVVFESLENVKTVDLEKFDFVISDYYLRNGDTGVDVAHWLEESRYLKPIFLSSNVEGLNQSELSLFTAIVSKDPRTAWDEIKEEISSKNLDLFNSCSSFSLDSYSHSKVMISTNSVKFRWHKVLF